MIFIMAGINGLTDNNHDEMLSAYEGLLDGIRDVVPGIEIYIESVLPLSRERCGRVTDDGIISFNSKLERLAESEGCTYVDIHRHYYRDGFMDPDLTGDGIHLNPDAYGLWIDEIAPLIY